MNGRRLLRATCRDGAVRLSESFGWLTIVDEKILVAYRELRDQELQEMPPSPSHSDHPPISERVFRVIGALFLSGATAAAVAGLAIFLVGSVLFSMIGEVGGGGGGGLLGIGLGIPPFPVLTTMSRARQKRTMADLRNIATSIEAYATDHNSYPPASPTHKVADIEKYLTPTYLRRVPVIDGWGNPILYYAWNDDTAPASNQGGGANEGDVRSNHYALVATGKDGVLQLSGVPKDWTHAETATIEDDILYRDGKFIRYPMGIQAE
jgi:type II secretory pathway pseudopilin PulG